MADDQLGERPSFEALINQARAGRLSRGDLMLAFLDASIVVPSGSNIAGGQGHLQPVQVERSGVTWMVVFTSLEGAKAVSHIAPYAVTLQGSTIIAGLTSGSGLVVNPDGVGFEVEPSLVSAIQRDQKQRGPAPGSS